MVTGDSRDMLRRLTALVPVGWFGDVSPLKDVIFGGIADGLAWAFSMLQVARAGTRRQGTAGWLLDVDAWGFFGTAFLRRKNEADADWWSRYAAELFRERVTRAGLKRIAEIETGKSPEIIELWNTGDTGAWDVPQSLAWGGSGTPATIVSGWDGPQGAWDTPSTFTFATAAPAVPASGGAGLWGSTDHPFQVFMTVIRPAGQGTPYIAGWDSFAAGWDAGPIEWISTDPTGAITDEDIYASIAATAAAGVTVWVRIINAATNAVETPTAVLEQDAATLLLLL